MAKTPTLRWGDFGGLTRAFVGLFLFKCGTHRTTQRSPGIRVRRRGRVSVIVDMLSGASCPCRGAPSLSAKLLADTVPNIAAITAPNLSVEGGAPCERIVWESGAKLTKPTVEMVTLNEVDFQAEMTRRDNSGRELVKLLCFKSLRRTGL